jgi:flagellar protein FliO/FliZ
MDLGAVDYVRYLLALVIVLGLIGGLAVLGRRLGFGDQGALRSGRRRLAVVESLMVDGKRRLVLLRRDSAEHLVLLGPGADVVIETHIATPAKPAPPAEQTP